MAGRQVFEMFQIIRQMPNQLIFIANDVVFRFGDYDGKFEIQSIIFKVFIEN